MIDLSIILSTKDEEKYIEQTLTRITEACQEAASRNIHTEIIVIDGSSDKTALKAKQFTRDVHIIKPRGFSNARNSGARLASGRILVFMDADTIIQEHSLRELEASFKDAQTVASVPYVLPFNHPKSFSNRLFYAIDAFYIRSCAYLPFLLGFYNRGDMIAVRRDAYRKVDGFDEDLQTMEVPDFLRRLLPHGKIRILSTPVFDSGRRLSQWGLMKSHKIWWTNYFSFYLFGHPHDMNYEKVR